jgi:hypothetical protein
MAAGPESSNSGIPGFSGFRVCAFGAPRNDAGGFFNSLQAAMVRLTHG